MIITEEFRDAAAMQARALGYEPAIVWVPHPIQNLSAEELVGRAAGAVEEALARISPA